ncbi:MAG TPA: hypothetical protein VIY49_15985 [Bryobacteraceae bacterium]
MGSMIEINDTLQLTTEQGFPADILDLARHRKNPVTLEEIGNRVFSFQNKPNARMFQLDPVRVYYVHNIGGKWLFWGHVFIQSLSITKDQKGNWITGGTYKIVEIYPPDYQEIFSKRESPPGAGYFDGSIK